MQNIKIVYSLRRHLELRHLGFINIEEMKNPLNPRYNCWIYEATEDFMEAFRNLAEEDQKNGR